MCLESRQIVCYIFTISLFVNPAFSSERPFDTYFQLVDEIQLPDDPILGDVFHLSVDSGGRILVTDNFLQQVVLYREDGSVIKILDPEECLPGTDWAPYKGIFDNDDNIFVTNTGPWGIRFKSDGTCQGVMGYHFIAPVDLVFDNSGRMYGVYTEPHDPHIKVMDSEGRVLDRFGEFPGEFRNLISRLGHNFIATDGSRYIYHTHVMSHLVHVYGLSGSPERSFGSRPSFFRQVRSDLPEDLNDMMRDVGTILKDLTTVYSLHLVERDTLLIQYVHHGTYYMQVITSEGETLHDNNISNDRPFFAARNGLFYMVSEHRENENGEVVNPVIRIYRFLGGD
jgi:hypothetical protein